MYSKDQKVDGEEYVPKDRGICVPKTKVLTERNVYPKTKEYVSQRPRNMCAKYPKTRECVFQRPRMKGKCKRLHQLLLTLNSSSSVRGSTPGSARVPCKNTPCACQEQRSEQEVTDADFETRRCPRRPTTHHIQIGEPHHHAPDLKCGNNNATIISHHVL
jgi:hypothetical protein